MRKERTILEVHGKQFKFLSKDASDEKRVRDVTNYLLSKERDRSFVLDQAGDGKTFYVTVGKTTKIAKDLPSILQLVKELNAEPLVEKPTRHAYVPTTPGPMRDRMLRENAAIDAAEKSEKDRRQAVDDQRRLADQIAERLAANGKIDSEVAGAINQDLQKRRVSQDIRIENSLRRLQETYANPEASEDERKAVEKEYYLSHWPEPGTE